MIATQTPRQATKRQATKRHDQPTAQPIEPLYSIKNVATVLNVSRRTVERDIATGDFPGPDLHVGKMPRWKPETVRTWMSARAAKN